MHMDCNSLISDIYDASTSDQDWSSLGQRLFRFFGAEAGTFRFRDGDGRYTNVFQTSSPDEDSYSSYYLHIDPVRSAISRMKPAASGAETVVLVDEVVDAERYRRSEFYQDFARPNGRENMLIGLVGDSDHTIMSFFRDGRAFGSRERTALEQLMPHVRRGLRMRQRLFESELASRLTYAAFEALPGSALVVDGDCNVLFANTAAKQTLSSKGFPISLSKVLTTRSTRLVVNGGEGAKIRQVVRSAADGGSGGATRIEFDAAENYRLGQLAVFATPLPAQGSARALGTLVLLLINDISKPRSAPPRVFSDLFGLSAAEGAVAAALLGGQTAEIVARDRAVSLDTVRTQIRTVLRKTDAANLRDFERIGALLGTYAH
jgi:DNA-binding CsgD family transcriptional regulator